jgi:hypothetical protein
VQTIVWDIDDVLNGLMRAWFEQRWQAAHPGSGVSYEDLKENPPCRALGMDMAEYLASLDEFRLSPQGRELAPNRDVLEWLDLNGAAYRHVALTARPMETAPQAADWLFRHFGRYFRCFGVVPSRPETAAPVYDRHKGDFLEWLGQADFFVDDSQENVTLAAGLGVTSILYPQPWNRSQDTVSDVLRSLTTVTCRADPLVRAGPPGPALRPAKMSATRSLKRPTGGAAAVRPIINDPNQAVAN